MTDQRSAVVGGVDAHTDEHHVAVLDAQGRLLGTAAFPTTAEGYAGLIRWTRRHGKIERVGVESTGAYAAGLVRALRSAGIRVVEVNQPHPHARQRLGKSDPIDAELAARAALSGQARAVPKQTSGIVEAIRQLHVARTGALKARTAALQQLDDLLITAPQQLRDELRRGRTLKARAALCLHLRPDTTRLHEPMQAAKLSLRSLARRIRALERELSELDAQLEQLAAIAAPRTIQLFGVGPQSTSQLLVTAGQNIERLKSEAAFAKLCAAAPIQASSGRTNRHRLDYGGDRQANRALHMIAVCRLRHDPRTRAYAERRKAEGLNRREIIRCLKRYIAREIYQTLRADLTTLTPPQPTPRTALTLACGAGPRGVTRKRP
jgi:transposase